MVRIIIVRTSNFTVTGTPSACGSITNRIEIRKAGNSLERAIVAAGVSGHRFLPRTWIGQSNRGMPIGRNAKSAELLQAQPERPWRKSCCACLAPLLRGWDAGSNRFVRLEPRTLTRFNSGSSAHKRFLKTQCDSMFRSEVYRGGPLLRQGK